MIYSQKEITDEKGTENVDADLLSRVTIDSTIDITRIDDYFPYKSLLSLSSMPWFAKNINFLASEDLPTHWSTQDKRKFLNEVNFYWDDPYLFKYCPDQIFQRCIANNEVSSVIKLCHSKACGSPFSLKKKRMQKSYKMDCIGLPCSRTRMHSAKLVKIVKKLILVKKFCFIILDSIYFLES
jgi:hypothetical protein